MWHLLRGATATDRIALSPLRTLVIAPHPKTARRTHGSADDTTISDREAGEQARKVRRGESSAIIAIRIFTPLN